MLVDRSLFLSALPLEDDLEEAHERLDGARHLVHLRVRRDRVLEQTLLLVRPL